MDFDYIGFGQRLRRARLALGLTEQEAAEAARRTVETWRNYEATGKGYCTSPVLRFSEKFDVSLDWLLVGEGRPFRRSQLRLVHSSDVAVQS
jgi:transcriptional regulator with XRE-family HTH domain